MFLSSLNHMVQNKKGTMGAWVVEVTKKQIYTQTSSRYFEDCHSDNSLRNSVGLSHLYIYIYIYIHLYI